MAIFIPAPLRVDGTTLQNVGGIVSINDQGVDAAQLKDSTAVTADKQATDVGVFRLGNHAGSDNAAESSGNNVAAGVTAHAQLDSGAGAYTWETAGVEANRQRTVKKATRILSGQVRVTANATTGASTFELRKNGAAVASISIPAGQVGYFTLAAFPVDFAVGDLWNVRLVNGGGGTITVQSWGFTARFT